MRKLRTTGTFLLVFTGAANAAEVVKYYQNNFEHRTASRYSTVTDFEKDWGTRGGNRILEPIFEKNSTVGGTRYMRISYPSYDKSEWVQSGTSTSMTGTGPGTGGGQWYVPISSVGSDDAAGGHKELYLSYKIYFPKDWDGVNGGKLPGLSGGTSPGGGGSSDTLRADGSKHEGSNKDPGDGTTDGFSARLMFKNDMKPFVYLYSAKHIQTPTYSKDAKGNWVSPVKTYGEGITPTFGLERGKWNTITERIVMNDLNAANGIVEVWFNGKLAIQKKDVKFRVGAKKNFAINRIMFSTFYGGGGGVFCETVSKSGCSRPVAKHVTCREEPSNSCSDIFRYRDNSAFLFYAPRKDESVLFDDVIVYKYKPGTGVITGNVASPATRTEVAPAAGAVRLTP